MSLIKISGPYFFIFSGPGPEFTDFLGKLKIDTQNRNSNGRTGTLLGTGTGTVRVLRRAVPFPTLAAGPDFWGTVPGQVPSRK